MLLQPTPGPDATIVVPEPLFPPGGQMVFDRASSPEAGAIGTLVFLGFVLAAGLLILQMVRSGARLGHNLSQPEVTQPARVVSKRTQVMGTHHRARTQYFVTFEAGNGDRLECKVSGQQFGLMAEGDQGRLTRQGTMFHRFERDRSPA